MKGRVLLVAWPSQLINFCLSISNSISRLHQLTSRYTIRSILIVEVETRGFAKVEGVSELSGNSGGGVSMLLNMGRIQQLASRCQLERC